MRNPFFIIAFAYILITASSCQKPINTNFPTDMKHDHQESISVIGHTKVWVNDTLYIDQKNSIEVEFRQHLRDALNSDVSDKSINNLFPAGEKVVDATHDGEDGIAVVLDPGGIVQYWVLDTDTDTPAQTYGKKWTGTVLITEDNLDPTSARIGFNWTGQSFTLRYAIRSLNALPVVNTNDRINIEWEIYIS